MASGFPQASLPWPLLCFAGYLKCRHFPDNTRAQAPPALRGQASTRQNQQQRISQGSFQFLPNDTTFSLTAAFLTQTVCLDDTTVKFEIWDTAGQERYHSLAPMYYRGAQAAIVVYDITNTVKISLLFSLPFISVNPQEVGYKTLISDLCAFCS